MKYSMAGFTNSINGLWTFLDIDEGDYISFLYGARVKNLYRVIKKVAYKNAENLPPWPPVTFKMSGNTYYFPFRLFLKQERKLDEPMVRPEFSYVAENLLLRGGYRKTHFQADTITFYNVSEMGESVEGKIVPTEIIAEPFEPKLVFKKELQSIPEKFYFKELILQSLVRRKLQDIVLAEVLSYFNVKGPPEEFEILGEKALPEGFVDLFIKRKHPTGTNTYILVEVKTGKAQKKDIEQLEKYLHELGSEVAGGILIAKDFCKFIADRKLILPIRYHFGKIEVNIEYTYNTLLNSLQLELVA